MDGYDVYAQERDIQQQAEENARRRTAVKAWGCSAEAQGQPRCGSWCEAEACPSAAGVAPCEPPDLSEILSGETLTQREEVCAAWADLPDDLRKDSRLTRLYRALGGPRMDDPTEATGGVGVPVKEQPR